MILRRIIVVVMTLFWMNPVHASGVAKEDVAAQIEQLGGQYAPAYQDQAKDKLVKMGRQALPTLTASLNHDRPDVSFRVLEVVARIGDPASAEAVLGFLDKSESADLTAQSIKTLGELKAGHAVPKIISLLKSAPEKHFFERDAINVAGAAMYALADLKPEQAAPEIMAFAKAHYKMEYLVLAATALGKLGDVRAQPYLLELMKYRDAEVRFAAVEALAAFNGTELLEPFWEAFQNETNSDTQHAILNHLASIGGESTIIKLIDMLGAGRDFSRQSLAEEGLRMIGAAAVPQMIVALELPDPERKVHLIRILSDIHGNGAVPHFMKLAEDKDQSVQISAIEALGKCGDASAIPFLNRIGLTLKNPVRKAASSARKKIAQRSGAEPKAR